MADCYKVIMFLARVKQAFRIPPQKHIRISGKLLVRGERLPQLLQVGSQHGSADACAVHKGNVPLRISCWQREGPFRFRPVRFRHFQVFGNECLSLLLRMLKTISFSSGENITP